jgi:NADPH-dependent curcumin reductase CurA
MGHESTGREIRLAARPSGEPRESDFELVEVPVPEPQDGEVLVRNTWMSLDPAMRIRMHEGGSYMPAFEVGRPLDGAVVGEVVDSRAPGFAAGDSVIHRLGWREYALLDANAPPRDRPAQIDVGDSTSARAYLGPLGVTGLTAYAGLIDVAEMREGDVVFISAAAGAVGSLAVQIAKLRGHTVIGSAGSAEKCRFVAEELGADATFCYRDGDVGQLLAAAAPDGIDLYFDNVGGDHLEAALDSLRGGGRVALCGAIGDYNATEPVKGPSNLFHAVAKGLTLRGFLARYYVHRMDEFRTEMRGWLREDRIVYRETVADGLERAPRAFIGMLRGENTGKTLVKLR